MEKSGWQGAIPFVVAIDSKGQVQFAQAGVMSEEDLGQYVEKFSK
jgi:predicted transcriptional regulator